MGVNALLEVIDLDAVSAFLAVKYVTMKVYEENPRTKIAATSKAAFQGAVDVLNRAGLGMTSTAIEYAVMDAWRETVAERPRPAYEPVKNAGQKEWDALLAGRIRMNLRSL